MVGRSTLKLWEPNHIVVVKHGDGQTTGAYQMLINMKSPRMLHYPAPWSDTKEIDGKWHHIPWTKETMEAYEAAGGWFKKNFMGFLDARYRLDGVSRKQAEEVEVVEDNPIQELLANLSKADREKMIAELRGENG